jgi:hypothetical protein
LKVRNQKQEDQKKDNVRTIWDRQRSL